MSGCRWNSYSGACENVSCNMSGYDCSADREENCYCKPMKPMSSYADPDYTANPTTPPANSGYGQFGNTSTASQTYSNANYANYVGPALSPTYGYCYRSNTDGTCVLSRNPADENDYCYDTNNQCQYISKPPYGCSWNEETYSVHDFGCSSNPNHKCVCRSPGDCYCKRFLP